MRVEPGQTSLGKTRLSAEDLKDVADNMAGSVLDACRAHAVFFAFETGHAGRRCVLGFEAQTLDGLAEALEEFAMEKCDSKFTCEPGGVRMFRMTAGAEYVFVLLPLSAEGQDYGAMALAISRENWAAQRAFAACSQVARLVGLNLSAMHMRAKLESDLDDLNALARHLQRQAEVDPLTEVENKASFETRAAERLTDPSRPAALIVIDLDYFKDVNDIYGHQFGDTYLQTIARSIRTALPDTALVGRVGGDEFAALIELPEPGQAYLMGLLSRLRATVQRSAALLGKSDLGQLSIGGALYPEHGQGYAELFALADGALYQSKDADRNTTTIYTADSPGPVAQHRIHLGRCGLDSVVAEFQPIVDLSTGACSGLEALARPKGAARGDGSKALAWMFRDHTIAPGLTRHMLNCALSTLSDLPAQMRPDLWINLTKFDLLDPDFVFDLQALLDRHSFDWDRIVVEVHETVMMPDRGSQTYHNLQEVRRRGARVALDDFGSGYAGLTHMQHWPVDIIKIDRAFTKGLETDSYAQTVVEALRMITKSCHVEIVAEGLETEGQVRAAASRGCRFGQGFVFDAALPADELMHRLAQYGTPNMAQDQIGLHA